jgi:hypothetical protein
VKATRVRTVAFDAKYTGIGSESGRKTTQGDGFLDRPLSSVTAPRRCLMQLSGEAANAP